MRIDFYLNVHVVLGHIEKGGQALAEPHGDVSVHVDCKRLKTFLETTHGVILKSTGVLAQVHMADLRHAETAHGDETWGEGQGMLEGWIGSEEK